MQLRAGTVSLFGCLMILLLSADFFLPMRLLGSFFHIAMNGMAAWEKMEGISDLQTPVSGTKKVRKGLPFPAGTFPSPMTRSGRCCKM